MLGGYDPDALARERLRLAPRYYPIDAVPDERGASPRLVGDSPRDLGQEQALRHKGDAVAACRASGLSVTLVPPSAMAQIAARLLGRRGAPPWGLLHRATRAVYISNALSQPERRLAAAHELAHWLRPTWTEEEADAFAAGFLAG